MFLGARAPTAPASAPADAARPADTDAPNPLGTAAAPKPRPGFGAALSLVRAPHAAPAAPAAAPASDVPPEPPPTKGWHKSAARRVTSLFIAATDKVIEKRGREPVETPDDDPDRLEMAAELSAQFAIWFPDTALPPWGRVCIVAAGIASEKWITATPIPLPTVATPVTAPARAPAPVVRAVDTAVPPLATVKSPGVVDSAEPAGSF